MKIRILLFAALREAVGSSQVEVEVAEGATPVEAFDSLAQRFPAITLHRNSLSFAVDDEFVASTTTLKSGSELALIPPVSGG